MNSLRLLSRGTGLSRKRDLNRQADTVPSEGQALNPQLFGSHAPQHVSNDLDTTGEGDVGSKKRKRETRPSSESIPQELDFFSGITTRSVKSSQPVAKDADQRRASRTQDPTDAQGSNGARSSRSHVTLPEEECRRILNAHKIKITQLWSLEPTATSGHTRVNGEKKRKRDERRSIQAASVKRHKKQKLEVVPQPLLSFGELQSRYGVSRRIVTNLVAQGYTVPTEVQLSSLPLLLRHTRGSKPAKAVQEEAGESKSVGKDIPGESIDLLTVAPTGSGKTLAFLVPVLNGIMRRRKVDSSEAPRDRIDTSGTMAIIIAPTKELASQIVNEGKKLCVGTGIKVALVRKGMNLSNNVVTQLEQAGNNEVESGNEDDNSNDIHPGSAVVKSHVLVSTPLTLLNAITTQSGGAKPLPSIQYLVLDEADVLLDELFRSQTLQIWSACTNPSLRLSLWSATMGASIEEIAQSTIEKRWQELKSDFIATTSVQRGSLIRLVVGLKDSAIPNIQHKLVYAGTEQGKLMALRQLLRPSAPTGADAPPLRPPFLVFVQTIPRAVALHSELLYEIPAEAGGSARIAVLHADLSDTARDLVMTRFRKGEIWVLITTDLLSRGVDFRGVNGVVNYDFPNSSAVYVHRVGRTGRAGREGGVAVTLYAQEDIPFVKNVANVIAAAERQKTTKDNSTGIQQWLLDAMPKPTKREKQRLKKRGVESRRTVASVGPDGKMIGKTRISTKSGYQRKLENNRREAVRSNLRRGEQSPSPAIDGAADEFSGFDD